MSGREDLNLRPFGPEMAVGSVAAGANASQVSEKIANREGDEVQPSQLSTGVSKDFTTRLLPKIGTGFAPGTAPKVATTPTTADLVALHGGRDQLLSVADVAKRLGVCAATVYRLCERGELPHVRIVNSIRIRPSGPRRAHCRARERRRNKPTRLAFSVGHADLVSQFLTQLELTTEARSSPRTEASMHEPTFPA